MRPSGRAGARAPSTPRLILLAVAGVGLAVIGLFRTGLLRPDPSVPVLRSDQTWKPARGEFAGDNACAECHQKQFTAHQASAHARTLRRLKRGDQLGPHITAEEVRDPMTAAGYSLVRRGDRHYLRIASGSLEASVEAKWQFGSGRHAFGYLVQMEDDTWIDSRINWYALPRKWDFASGQDRPSRSLTEQPLGRVLPKAEVARCFSCHTTRLYAAGAAPEGVPGDRLEIRLDRTVAGVGCEACHGPGREHIREVRSGKPRSPVPAMSADAMNRLCGECHSRSDLTPNHEVIARFQPWGLQNSKCFQESGGRLSCSTCHDPHSDVSKEATFYESRCLSCHDGSSRQRTPCPVSPRRGCLPCHMPRDTKSMLHMTFSDHRIRVIAGVPKPAGSAP